MTNVELDKPMTKYRREMLEAMPSVSKCIMPHVTIPPDLLSVVTGLGGTPFYWINAGMKPFQST